MAGEFLDNAGWDAISKNMLRHILHHDGTRADVSSSPNADVIDDGRAHSHPRRAPDSNATRKSGSGTDADASFYLAVVVHARAGVNDDIVPDDRTWITTACAAITHPAPIFAVVATVARG